MKFYEFQSRAMRILFTVIREQMKEREVLQDQVKMKKILRRDVDYGRRLILGRAYNKGEPIHNRVVIVERINIRATSATYATRSSTLQETGGINKPKVILLILLMHKKVKMSGISKLVLLLRRRYLFPKIKPQFVKKRRIMPLSQ